MYKQREIILIPFPYTDLSATKQRPALIVSNNDYNSSMDDVVVCAVTSRHLKDKFSIEITNSDLEIGVLPEASVVKAHKIFTIHQSKIIKKFSVVNEVFYEKVEQVIKELVEKP